MEDRNTLRGIWELLGCSPLPILSFVLDICPGTYFYLPPDLKNNENVVRQLLLHHGHMWPLIPTEFRSNTGFMLMALQSAPQILAAYMHVHMPPGCRLATHPIVQAITSITERDWNPLVDRQRNWLKHSHAAVAPTMPDESSSDGDGFETDSQDARVRSDVSNRKRRRRTSHTRT